MSDRNITPYNDNNNRHGYWERYWGNGDLSYKCFYKNGIRVGYEEEYWYGDDGLRNKKYHIR